MSDTEIQDTTDVVVPVTDQPNEEPTGAIAPVVSENPTTPAEAPAESAAPTGPVTRAKASDLEGDLRKVLDDYVTGLFKFPEGTLPTPHALAAEIAKRRGDGHAVSSGAVSAALTRWQEIGFATLGAKPMQFIDYTPASRSQGLTALKQAFRASKSAARKAAQEPAPVAAATVPLAAPEAPVPTQAAEGESSPVADGGTADANEGASAEPAAEASTPSDGTPF